MFGIQVRIPSKFFARLEEKHTDISTFHHFLLRTDLNIRWDLFFFTFDKTYQLIALMTIEFGFHFFCKVERIRRAFYQRIFGSRSLHSSARIHVLLFRSFVWAFLGKFSCWFRPGCNILLVDLLDSNQGNEFFLFPIWLKNY